MIHVALRSGPAGHHMLLAHCEGGFFSGFVFMSASILVTDYFPRLKSAEMLLVSELSGLLFGSLVDSIAHTYCIAIANIHSIDSAPKEKAVV